MGRSKYVVCTSKGCNGWAWESKWAQPCRQCSKNIPASRSPSSPRASPSRGTHQPPRTQQWWHNKEDQKAELAEDFGDVQRFLDELRKQLASGEGVAFLAQAPAALRSSFDLLPVPCGPPKPESMGAAVKLARADCERTSQAVCKIYATITKHTEAISKHEEQLAEARAALQTAKTELIPAFKDQEAVRAAIAVAATAAPDEDDIFGMDIEPPDDTVRAAAEAAGAVAAAAAGDAAKRAYLVQAAEVSRAKARRLNGQSSAGEQRSGQDEADAPGEASAEAAVRTATAQAAAAAAAAAEAAAEAEGKEGKKKH